MSKLLTDYQKTFLKGVSKSGLARFFVWSGGTALSYRYLRHRVSVDLDFLSQDLLPADYLLSQMKEIAKSLKIKKIEEQSRLNRHEFWLKKGKETLRVEFVFYPFPRIRSPKTIKEFGLKVDSIEDILTNKMHAVYERTEPKDVFDFYCILRVKKISMMKVFKWVEKKFGVSLDPVLFISKLFQGVNDLNKIKPLVFKKTLCQPSQIKQYFQKEAENYLKRKIKK